MYGVVQSNSSVSKSQISMSSSAQQPVVENPQPEIERVDVVTPAALSAADVSVEAGTAELSENKKETNDELSGSQAQTIQGGVLVASTTSNGSNAHAPEEFKKYTPGAYMQREEDFIQREKSGEYTFPYIFNDAKPENLIW